MKGIFFKDFTNSYIPEILQEIYQDKVYQPFLEDKKDLTIMDVGANIGLFTLYASQFAKKIYSVEPAGTHMEVLSTMVRYNNLKNVTTIKKALSHENGTADFYHSENVTMYSLNKLVDNTNEKETVETITIDKLFKDYGIEHIDFMKLDVEGAEGLIVGSKGFKSVAKKIDTVVLEWHSWSGFNPAQLVTTIQDYGYKVKPLKTDATLYACTR
jgi:FkbM family methyltransferase